MIFKGSLLVVNMTLQVIIRVLTTRRRLKASLEIDGQSVKKPRTEKNIDASIESASIVLQLQLLIS